MFFVSAMKLHCFIHHIWFHSTNTWKMQSTAVVYWFYFVLNEMTLSMGRQNATTTHTHIMRHMEHLKCYIKMLNVSIILFVINTANILCNVTSGVIFISTSMNCIGCTDSFFFLFWILIQMTIFKKKQHIWFNCSI